MLILNISSADIFQLKYERYTYPCSLVQKRLQVLYIKSQLDLSHQMIAKIVGVHRDTVTDYIKMYNIGGLELIYKIGYGTNKSALEKEKESLLDYFEQNPPHTINGAKEKIKELTGLERSPSQVRVWMKSHGLKYRKTGQIPAKANPEVQQEYVDKVLNPLILRAENEEIHLLFMDAAHFVMGVFLSCLWSIKRVFVKSSSGRKRYNVLGVANAISKEIHIWTNQTYINSESIIDFFEQLYAHYYDKPIYIVMDNARYQKCQLVKYVAWQFNIHLIYLPPYSPNLNIIERLWKWVKKEALYARYYENFDLFQEAINTAIQKANTTHKEKIRTLLNLKFQMF